MKTLVDGRLKLIWAPRGKDQAWIAGRGQDPALFDLVADPGENHDISAERPEEFARMSRQIWNWFNAPEFVMERDPDECSGSRETSPHLLKSGSGRWACRPGNSPCTAGTEPPPVIRCMVTRTKLRTSPSLIRPPGPVPWTW